MSTLSALISHHTAGLPRRFQSGVRDVAITVKVQGAWCIVQWYGQHRAVMVTTPNASCSGLRMPRLEQLEVWKSARETAHLAYALTAETGLKHHFALIDQIRRSAISIPSNISEGYGLATKAQFIRASRIALGSAYELQTQLYLVGDLGLASADSLSRVQVRCRSTIKLLIALLRSLGGTLDYR